MTGRTAAGDPLFGPAVAIACRVEGSTATLRSSTGIETNTDTRIISEVAIAKTSRVWLPGTNTADASAAKVPRKVRLCPTGDASYTLWETLLG